MYKTDTYCYTKSLLCFISHIYNNFLVVISVRIASSIQLQIYLKASCSFLASSHFIAAVVVWVEAIRGVQVIQSGLVLDQTRALLCGQTPAATPSFAFLLASPKLREAVEPRIICNCTAVPIGIGNKVADQQQTKKA